LAAALRADFEAAVLFRFVLELAISVTPQQLKDQ
jgi:hypothetical protein